MSKLFKLMTILLISMIGISCNSGLSDPSSYVELMKNQTISMIDPNATIGEVFDAVSKRKVVWEALPMPANDSEYQYRNIHKTSVLVQATLQMKYLYVESQLQLKKDATVAIQFAVKKDKSEFELYRAVVNGEYQNMSESIHIVQAIGANILK